MAGLSRHQPPGCWESNPLCVRVSVLGSRSHMPLLKKSLVWAWLMPATSHLPLLPASSETIVCLSPSAPQRGVFSDPHQPIPLNLSVYWATTWWQFLFVLHCIYPNSRYILTGVCICLILVFPLLPKPHEAHLVHHSITSAKRRAISNSMWRYMWNEWRVGWINAEI